MKKDLLSVGLIDNNANYCQLHGSPLEVKWINVGTYIANKKMPVKVLYCKECNKNYIERKDFENYEYDAKRYGYKIEYFSSDVIQKKVKQKEAIKLDNNISLYGIKLNNIKNYAQVCPVDNSNLLSRKFCKEYKGRRLDFQGYLCPKCQRVYIDVNCIYEIQNLCAKKGLPPFNIEVQKDSRTKKHKSKLPDYFIHNGVKDKYSYGIDVTWKDIDKNDTVVVGHSSYCEFDDHSTSDVLGLVKVVRKAGGSNSYLVLMGYCSDCEKYYISKEDYDYIYKAGRAKCVVIDDTDTYDFITSGDTFDLEEKHLDSLERNIDRYIHSIKSSSGYVNPYAAGGDYYDIVERQKQKAFSKKYTEEIKKVERFIPRPYTGRLDIVSPNKQSTFYVGIEDVVIDGNKCVYSRWSEEGKLFGDYRSTKLSYKGTQYSVKLRRQFDIAAAKLFGYQNTHTDEDSIFRKGITDPFLIRVLKTRKRQHQLTDIISTIQERQNEIIDVPLAQNIVVQGCAGSGKTMVLLHRISSLKYNNPDFNFDNAVILTPNENFNKHIKGLTDDLRLGRIDRYTVEEYYKAVLSKYDKSMFSASVDDEGTISTKLVQYMYSNEYIEDFNKEYHMEIENLKNDIEIIKEISHEVNYEVDLDSYDSDYKLLMAIKGQASRLNDVLDEGSFKIKLAEERQANLQKEIDKIDNKLPDIAEIVNNGFAPIASKINKYAQNLLDEKEVALLVSYRKKDDIIARIEGINKSRISIGKASRTKKLYDELEGLNKKIQAIEDEKEELVYLATELNEKMEYSERQKALNMALKLDKEFSEYINKYQGYLSQYIRLLNDKEVLISKVNEEVDKITSVKEAQFTSNIISMIEDINRKYNSMDVLSLHNTIYKNTLSKLGDISSKLDFEKTYRFTLYSQLRFCHKLFNSSLGDKQIMFIDEGQDISINEYRLFDVINSGKVIYNIYGDVNQLLKVGIGIANWERLTKLFNCRRFVLNENYRNTNQITKYCNTQFNMNTLLTGVDGKKVRNIPRIKLESELSSYSLGDERIAILIPKSINSKKFIDKEQLPIEMRSLVGSEIKNGYITILTVEEVKGIEFDRVYVVPEGMSKNEQYIAYTRALSELVIVGE